MAVSPQAAEETIFEPAPMTLKGGSKGLGPGSS